MLARNIILTISFLILIYYYYWNHLDFYKQIFINSRIPDYTRWILSDKYIAKRYAALNGFKVPQTYQLVRYPQELRDIPDTCVIKPVDLCDNEAVFLIKNNMEIRSGKRFSLEKTVATLLKTRAQIYNEFYMHIDMYDGLVPFTGYIVEELLLDENGDPPCDYKCYTFGGTIFFIAVTYNRKKENGVQTFDVVWLDRDWNPVRTPMLQKGYKYQQLPKPKGFDRMIQLVEAMGRKFERHCRIDVYLIGGEVYLGEFTFFTGARLHTVAANVQLGMLWKLFPDNYFALDERLFDIVPKFYNDPYL